jgi:hypothetical protein
MLLRYQLRLIISKNQTKNQFRAFKKKFKKQTLPKTIIFVYNLELTVTAQARKYDELGKHLKLEIIPKN